MGFTLKEGYGSIFINNYKEGNQPDKNGELKLDKDYEKGDIIKISAWDKQTKNGDAYLSLSVDNFIKEDKPDDNPF